MKKKLPINKKTGRIPRNKIYQKGKMPSRKKEEVVEEQVEQMADSANPNELFGDKPINQLHKLLFFDNPLGRAYVEKTMGSYAAYNKIAKPETLTIEDLANISGLLGKNPVWLFCRLLADYTNFLAKAAQTPNQASTRYKRAYSFLSLSQSFLKSEGLLNDAQNSLYALAALLPPDRDKEAASSEDEQ